MDNSVHTLDISQDDAVTMSGVQSVDSLTDREAIVHTDKGKVTIRGNELSLYHLDSDKGTIVLNSKGIHSIMYANAKKISLKSLFGS